MAISQCKVVALMDDIEKKILDTFEIDHDDPVYNKLKESDELKREINKKCHDIIEEAIANTIEYLSTEYILKYVEIRVKDE